MLNNRAARSKTCRVYDSNPTAAAFGVLLQSFEGLTELYVARVRLESEHMRLIVGLLLYGTTLVRLELCSANLRPEHARLLAEALQHNTVLTALDLSDNQLGPDGTRALADALQVNTVLTALNLGSNELRLEGVDAIAEVLQQNTTLTKLRLHRNGLGTEGACALAAVLQQNTVLTTLDLDDNRLELDSAHALAEVLQHNTVLTALHLRGNTFSPGHRWGQYWPDGPRIIVDALQHNTTLTTFHFRPPGRRSGLSWRIRRRMLHNKSRAAWISWDGGLQRACIVSLFKQWHDMMTEEKTAFKINACQLPYLIRSRAAQQAECIAQIGLFEDEECNSPQQMVVDSGLGITATETACFFG
jgi:Leucine Rich repeat